MTYPKYSIHGDCTFCGDCGKMLDPLEACGCKDSPKIPAAVDENKRREMAEEIGRSVRGWFRE